MPHAATEEITYLLAVITTRRFTPHMPPATNSQPLRHDMATKPLRIAIAILAIAT